MHGGNGSEFTQGNPTAQRLRGGSGDSAASAAAAASAAERGDGNVMRFAVRARHKLLNKHRELCVQLRERKVVVHMSRTHEKKEFLCADVVHMARSPGSPAMALTIRGASGRVKEKNLVFEDHVDAALFHKVVNALNDYGPQLVDVFDKLDRTRTGAIRKEDLKAALSDANMDADEDRVAAFMRALQTGTMRRKSSADAQPLKPQGGSATDIQHGVGDDAIEAATLAAATPRNVGLRFFFENFMHLPVYSTEHLLSEWQKKVDGLAELEMGGGGSRTSIGGYEYDGAGGGTTPLLVGGEQLQNVVEHVRFCFAMGTPAYSPNTYAEIGSLFLTNYRLIFWPYVRRDVAMTPRTPRNQETSHLRPARTERPAAMGEICVPHGAIARVEPCVVDTNGVLLGCKDSRMVTLGFEANPTFVSSFREVIKAVAFPGAPNTFAFNHRIKVSAPRDGWGVYDPQREFVRQGLIDEGQPMNDRWRIYSDNYALSPTYPRVFVLPRLLSESEIMSAAKYRSKHRVPAVTYRHALSGAVMARSSQPMAGIGGHTNEADKRLLELLRVRGDPGDPAEQARPRKFWIVDARKPLATLGNRVQGKGVESASSYKHTALQFCYIENIHHMRAALTALTDLMAPSDTAESTEEDRFLGRLEDTAWPRHCRLVLESSVFIAEKMDTQGYSVLIHCSDGWDRTAQLCATTQLLLDPYYRTIEGFAVLVEKDWCAFGHKFQQRCGHGVNDPANEERSPIFLQWIEVVNQVREQFPDAFQFTDRLLVFVADHQFSCLFGNFLGNSEKERECEYEVRTRTESIWTYVLAHEAHFANDRYREYKGVLWPRTSIKKSHLWQRYFCRWDPYMHPRPPHEDLWDEDYGTGILDTGLHTDLDTMGELGDVPEVAPGGT
mmetsp:Transcript_23301/g.72919  ORF Transcript_23301/g.72919 Transcript_23301/m.72919 type:complete len:893 (-) Transcript_23301:3260-5938(-)